MQSIDIYQSTLDEPPKTGDVEKCARTFYSNPIAETRILPQLNPLLADMVSINTRPAWCTLLLVGVDAGQTACKPVVGDAEVLPRILSSWAKKVNIYLDHNQ